MLSSSKDRHLYCHDDDDDDDDHHHHYHTHLHRHPDHHHYRHNHVTVFVGLSAQSAKGLRIVDRLLASAGIFHISFLRSNRLCDLLVQWPQVTSHRQSDSAWSWTLLLPRTEIWKMDTRNTPQHTTHNIYVHIDKSPRFNKERVMQRIYTCD